MNGNMSLVRAGPPATPTDIRLSPGRSENLYKTSTFLVQKGGGAVQLFGVAVAPPRSQVRECHHYVAIFSLQIRYFRASSNLQTLCPQTVTFSSSPGQNRTKSNKTERFSNLVRFRPRCTNDLRRRLAESFDFSGVSAWTKNSSENLLHRGISLLYCPPCFPRIGVREVKTIYRQLFFVWLDNAFAFA